MEGCGGGAMRRAVRAMEAVSPEWTGGGAIRRRGRRGSYTTRVGVDYKSVGEAWQKDIAVVIDVRLYVRLD